MKTALVHDYLVQAGGAERLLATMHELYPDSPVYTSVYDPSSTLKCFAGMDIRTSYLQKWPFRKARFHKLALPYYPSAFEDFDLNEYDLVISSSSAFAKGVITAPRTCHVCYCHTPPRFAWRHHEYMSRGLSTRLMSGFMRGMLSNLRSWDYESSQRVDYFIANSENVARRIKKHYRRDATVIYPPVESQRFSPVAVDQVGDYFLVVSRLQGYKRIDIAIEACNRLRARLIVIGDGPEMKSLRRIAGPTIRFLGHVTDDIKADHYARCKAMILPGEEDFGITPLECMASGRPVVAYSEGGAIETVIEGVTGLFFRSPSADSAAQSLVAIDKIRFDPGQIRSHACKFDNSVFLRRIQDFMAWALDDYKGQFNRPFVSQCRAVDTEATALPNCACSYNISSPKELTATLSGSQKYQW